jgi:large repetitive protein
MTRLAAISSILRARSQWGAARRVRSIVLAIVVTLGVSVATLSAGAGPAGADDSAPTLVAVNPLTAYGGNPFFLQVQALGTPTSTLTLSGSTPAGMTFTDVGGGTGNFNWTPPADIATPETDSVTVTATNTVGTTTQTFSIEVLPGLTLKAPPTYTVADGDFLEAFWSTYDEAVSPPTLTESGALPAGITFDASHGDAQLDGQTNADGSADGVYPITVTAHNGIEPDETATTVITVEPPAPVTFTSAPSFTVQVGQPFSFTVTMGGAPSEQIWAGSVGRQLQFPSNPFPSGVDFVDNGDGTATISGTVQTAGQYPGQITTFYPHPGFVRPVQIFTLNAVLPGQASFTSAASATALVGDPFSFTVVTTGGDPTPALSLSGALPSTMNFTDNGDGTATISGAAPTDTDVGQYPLALTATNTVATTTQSFMLSVKQPVAPAFTSAATATAIIGHPFSFTVATAGTPTPDVSFDFDHGSPPPSFTFTDNGDGTATISGTGTAADDGSYEIDVTATSAAGTTTVPFNFYVKSPLDFKVPATFVVGDDIPVDILLDAGPDLPYATITESGTLPIGLTFVDSGQGHADIEGFTDGNFTQDGTYPISVTADDGVQQPITKTMTLTVEPPAAPVFTSAAATTVTVGQPFSFTVTTTGAPTPKIAAGGISTGHGFGGVTPPFPDGVSLTDNGDGTATISGTALAPGSYPSVLVASGPPLYGQTTDQSFTLTVVPVGQPAFQSTDTATAVVGIPFGFTVYTTGTPTPTLTLSGTLPAGLEFRENGDGTATILGTAPADADVGQYQPVTISATNSVGTTTQSLTLTVRPPLAITGPTTYTAADGTPFDVQPYAAGFTPEPSLTESGALPPGVTFVDSGSGYGDIEGTTSGDGSADGVYPITITADDGIEPDATKTVILTVAPPSPPAFTGATSATVEVGTPFSFTVAASGSPSPNVVALTRGPPFHSGVVVNDNEDGTGTISGTVDTPGTYQATLEASSGAGGVSEIFTLTVLQPAPGCVATACDSAVGTDPDGSVQAQSGGSTGLTATADGVGGLTVGQYTADPESSPAVGASGAYFDVADSSDNAFTSLTLDDCDLLGGNNVQWWNPNANAGAGAWQPVSNQTYQPGSPNCVEVDISPTTSPSLSDLSGTVFAVGSGNLAPTVTSASGTTATVGQTMSFTVTTSGFPAAALTRTGTLPTGVTFVDNGDGTATLSGTPSGTAKTYALKFTAKNAAGSVSQTFSLVVQQAPAITSATTVTFTTAKTGSFKVTTTGSPASELSSDGALPNGVNFVDNGNGTATLSGEASTGGIYPLTISATNAAATTSQSFTLVVNQVPTVTSPATATDTVGQPLSFDITTSSYPTAALTQTGTLPTGVTFVDNGDGTATLAGTPTGTAKTYALRFTAKNAAGSVSQSFSLAVNQTPAFTSAATATFTTGKSGTFKVTASGYPTPAMSYFGQLPEGLNLVDNGNGTATLSGTPAAGIGGTYTVAMRANNAVGRPVSQVFTLVINQAPSVTSAATTTVDVGQAMTFGVATTGFPTPALTETGTLPAGVTFTDNGDGTGTFSGAPTGTAKTYALKISAKNAGGSGTQSFSLVVQQAPAITSAATTTFTTTKTGTFKVTSSGSPVAALSSVGTLPTGVSFVDNGNGTATFTGAASTNGVYPLTISATNAAGTTSQNFTLVVNQVPTVTSAPSMTATIGHAMSFNVTTSGYPTAALTQTGTLPTGVRFVDNGDGTATLSGTPTGTAKTYTLKITAKNAAGSATQSFALVVHP